jgi:hypothetical protein
MYVILYVSVRDEWTMLGTDTYPTRDAAFEALTAYERGLEALGMNDFALEMHVCHIHSKAALAAMNK